LYWPSASTYSHTLYGIEKYANTHTSYLEKLDKLNNKNLGTLQNKPLLTPIQESYLAYNILPMKELHLQQILILVHNSNIIKTNCLLFSATTLP
jgi:hypothetical protein